MRSKMKGLKKFMAELLCTALIVCSLPGAAFAAEEEGTYKSSVSASYDADSYDESGSAKDSAEKSADTDSANTESSADTDSKKSDEIEEGSADTEKDSEDTGAESEDTGKDLSDSDKDTGEVSEDSDDTEDADAATETADTEEDADADAEEDSREDAEEDNGDAGSADSDDTDAEAKEADEGDGAAVPGGISSTSDDEENEEEEEDEEEDWLDGPLDEDIMLLATPSNIDDVACISDRNCRLTDNSFPTVQEAIDYVGNNTSYIFMYNDSTENITIEQDQNITLFLYNNTLTGTGNDSVITNHGILTLVNHDDEKDACITGGNATYGGGIYNDGTLIIDGMIITGNTAGSGGGVYNASYGKVTISSETHYTEISNNEARGSGGGVFNSIGTIDLVEGSIRDNTAGENGGGVLSNVGSFNMSGGEISDNYCEGNGGGMWLNDELHISGGVVENNEAASKGGGIYLHSCEPYFKGTPVVESNTDKNGVSNVYMPDNLYPYYLMLEGDLESGAYVGVTPREELTADNTVQVTRAESDTEYYINSAEYFFYDSDSGYLGAANTEKHYVEFTRSMAAGVIAGGGTTYRGRYMSLKEALDVAQNGDTVILLADSTDRFTLSSGRDITLDLNGYTLSGEGEGIVITIEEGATLTLDDSGDSGTITDGSRYNFGVGVNNRGTFNMKGGTISGNRATGTNSYGAGVYNGGTFNMSGGTISGNQADYGGGVYNAGTFILSGGKIAENTASRRGADIYSIAGSSMALIKASAMFAEKYPDKCYGWYMDSTGRYSPTHITAEYTDPAVVGASTPGAVSEDTALIAAGDAAHIYSETAVTLEWSGEDNNENCTAIFTCTDCGYEKAVEAEFTYDLIREATDTQPALAIYYVTAIVTSRGGEVVTYYTSEERSGNPPGGSGMGTTFVRSGRSASANASGGSYSVSSGTGVISSSQNYDTGTWSEDIFGNWRFISDSGKMYENEWGYIYNPYANVAIGQPEANWFHFGYNGIMDTGWFVDTDGIVYFLNAIPDNTQGRMMTGWQWLNGNWYYFAAGGGMMRNAQTPDGYRVDENGVLIAE